MNIDSTLDYFLDFFSKSTSFNESLYRLPMDTHSYRLPMDTHSYRLHIRIGYQWIHIQCIYMLHIQCTCIYTCMLAGPSRLME